MGGEGMPQRMDPKLVATNRIEEPVHEPLDAAGRQPPATHAHEYGPSVPSSLPHYLVPDPKILSKGRYRSRADRHQALLPPLAPHLRLIRQEIDVGQAQSREL